MDTEPSQMQKRRKIHLDIEQSVALSQSEEGTASLRQPIERKHPSRSNSDHGMEPRYRNRPRQRFRPPRKASQESVDTDQGLSSTHDSCSQEEDTAGLDTTQRSSTNTNSNSTQRSSTNTNSTHAASTNTNSNSTQAASGNTRKSLDPFDSGGEELEKEMVEQSNDQSIHLLSVYGGFRSAATASAGVGQQASVSVTSVGSSPSKNTSWGHFGRQKPAKKQFEVDSNQSCITRFMSLSSQAASSGQANKTYSSNASGSASSSNSGTRVSGPTDNEKVRKVSDSMYITISDDSSSDSLNQFMSGPSGTHSKSTAKTLFSAASSLKSSSHASSTSFKLKTASGLSRGGKKKSGSGARKSKSKSSAGASAGQKGKSKASSSQRTFSSTSSTLAFIDVDLHDSDSRDFEDPPSRSNPASVPSVTQEVEVGRTFGLLSDSRVRVVKENHFDRLPLDVVENIFCRLPMMELCITASRVCQAWNDVISSPKFIPWKKMYHRLKLGENSAKVAINKIISEENMRMPSLRLLKLLSYMQKLRRVDPHNNAVQLLKKHKQYTWAMALLQDKAPHCIKDDEPNPWSLMVAIVMVAGSVSNISTILHLLTAPGSNLLCLEVLECVYCAASFLLAFKQQHLPPGISRPESTELDVNLGGGKRSSVVNGMHYRLFYALYLYENTAVSNHSMLQEAMLGGSGQQTIVKYSAGDTEVRLTHEQMRIIKYTPDPGRGEVVKIFAFAGTGKTTTLVRYAQMRPSLKFLLIVFNKSVCTHAQSHFPPNVTCKTGHGLAFQAVGRRYAAEKQLNHGNLRVFDVAMALEARDEHKENQYVRAKFVMETVKKYMSSEDEDITTFHVPLQRKGDSGAMEPIPHSARMLYAKDATHLWERMKNMEDPKVRMTHDGYLKLFQLSKPFLRGYDIIMVDEAQDLTPALLDVVQRQRQARIFVGDQHQQIYAFRGAVNAMQGVLAHQVFYLTQSFRFGPDIAQVANTMLESLKGEHRKNIVGHASQDLITGEQKGQLAVLCRSNFTVFSEAVAVCVYSDQPVRVAFVGGLEAFGISMLMDIYTLLVSADDKKKDGREIQNRFIRGFQTLGDLEKYADKTLDLELLGKIKIVKVYHTMLPMCLAKIKEKAIGNIAMADVVFSTVHKAKGLEFSTVKVTDDFIDLHDIITKSTIERHNMSREEANLLYVAVTRAKHALIMSQTVRTLLSLMGGGCYQPMLTERLKQDGVPLTCLGTRKEFKPQRLTLYRPKVQLSTKRSVPGGVLSPDFISILGSEYAHLFGTGSDKVDLEDDNMPLIYEDDDFHYPWGV